VFSRIKLAGIAALCLTSLFPPISHAQAVNSHVQVAVDRLNVRSGPSLTYEIISTVNEKTTLPVLAEKNNWIQVKMPDGKSGWVASWMVKTVATAPAKHIQSKVDQLNVRSGPSTTFPVVKKIDSKTKYPLLQKSGEWAQIQLAADQKGWVASWLVQETQAAQSQAASSATAKPAGSVPANDGRTTITVTASSVNLRSMPTTQSKVIATLANGTKLVYLSTQGDWYQGKTADGQTGWVANWLVQKQSQGSVNGNQPAGPSPASERPTSSQQTEQGTVTILEPDTNVRSGPTLDFDVITRVQPNETYPIIGTEGEWFHIRLADGSTGYVAGWLVQTNGESQVIRSTDIKDKLIVVDAGHGGEDGGAVGAHFGTLEKDVNLQIALLLEKKLTAAGAKVILTRTDDRRLTLQNRVDQAVENEADLFVSVHHNTHPNPATNGTIVYYYDKKKSNKLAGVVQSELVKATGYKDMQPRIGDFYVLRENPVPSILAEIGFLTNFEEEMQIRSEKQQEAAAEGLYKGIVRYFQEGGS